MTAPALPRPDLTALRAEAARLDDAYTQAIRDAAQTRNLVHGASRRARRQAGPLHTQGSRTGTNMNKPLELTVHPLLVTATGQEVYDLGRPRKAWGETLTPRWVVGVEAKAKRFMDAELAADHFAQVAVSAQMDVHALLAGEGPAGEAFFEQSEIAVRQAEVLERFATLPHYDEEPTDGC